MRDLLPDLLHGRLSAEQGTAVREHLDACDDCRAELALLRQVREAAVAPPVDVARIVAALAPHATPARSRRTWGPVALRAAAAVVLVAGAATLLLPSPQETNTVQVADSTPRYVAPQELPLGETFQDVSDADLRALVEELREIDAVMIEDPDEVGLPIAPTEGT
jgi:anti-sigma factor RsiW